jgi:hypothetical protein
MEGVDRIQRTGDPERTGYCPPSKRIFGKLNYLRWKMRAHLFSTFNIQHSEFTSSPFLPGAGKSVISVDFARRLS